MLINYVTIFGKKDRGGKIKSGSVFYTVIFSVSVCNQVLIP